jgi:hypothetical protein
MPTHFTGGFLVFNDYQILKDLGVRSKQQADQKASSTYDEFNKTQKINSDFDKVIKQTQGSNPRK